jgi:hypothetical protein
MKGLFLQGRRYLGSVYEEVRHGARLKVLAIGSRGIFLLFVASRLAPGELTDYVFLSSIAILGARLLCFGLEEQLPLVISGNPQKAARLNPAINLLLVMEIALSLALSTRPTDVVLATALLMICYTTTSLMVGILRTVRIVGAERLRDLHWIVFVTILLAPFAWTAVDMLALLSASLITVQLLEVVLNRHKELRAEASLRDAAVRLLTYAKISWRKVLAAASILAIVRGIILWPKALGFDIELDNVAYALLLGEAFMQTAMILVYRRHAAYCSDRSNPTAMFRNGVITAVAITGYSLLAASTALLLSFLGVSLAGFSAWGEVALMIIFFGSLASYVLFRYIVWVIRDFDWALAGLEMLWFASQGVIILYLPASSWTPTLAAISLLFVLAAASLVRARIPNVTKSEQVVS